MFDTSHKINIHSSLFDNIYIIYIFLYANIFITPLFLIVPFPVWKLCSFIFLLFFFCYISISSNVRLKKIFAYIFLLSICTFFITAIYYASLYIILHNIIFLFTLILFMYFDWKHIHKFINASTIFILVLILGAYIGTLYALSGGIPIFSFYNGDGRRNYLYVTTCTNGVLGKYIRPSGIYDEPGALSFFICSICLLRVLYKSNDKITFLILLLGLITTSLTHILVLFCFILYYLSKYKKKKQTIFFVLCILLVTIVLIIFLYDLFDSLLFSRLQYNPRSGTVRGDTRSHLFKNALSLLDVKIFFWGISETAFTKDLPLLLQKLPLKVGENPLTQLLFYGFFSCWYYYVFLFIIFIAGLLKSGYFFIFFAVILLFLQRPYPEIISYSFYFVLFFYHAVITIKKYILKKYKRIMICYQAD